MESLKKICGHLEDCVLAELSKDKSQVDAKELGEVVDAIKDIKMAIYYATITEAMEKPENEYGRDYDENGRLFYNGNGRGMRGRRYYEEPYEMDMTEYKTKTPQEMRDMDKKMGRMYYTEPRTNGMHLKRYYEHKNMGDDNMKLKSLEDDLKEISEELTNVVGDMNNSEKTMLKTKLQTIAQRL